jgi:HlyD family secretion protein
MSAWNQRAFAAVALALGAVWLSSIINNAQETNDRGFVSSALAQPAPIRKLIEWLRGMTMPAGIVKAEGRIEATQIDVATKYAGELVEITVHEGDEVAPGQVIARLMSPELETQLQAAQSKLQSARETRAQDAIQAAEVKIGQINSMISDLRVVSPREGKVQYQLAHAGDIIAAGAPIVTLIDLTDVYMTVFVRAADATKLGLGDQARLILDGAPDSVIPATVGFVASGAASSNAAETKDQLAKEMFRVDLKVDPKVLQTYYAKVETGLRGAGFVRTRADTKWPPNLKVKLPPAPIAQESRSALVPLGQEAATPSAPTSVPSVASAPPDAPPPVLGATSVAEAAALGPNTLQTTPAFSPVSASAPVPPLPT